ncbi:hypothetical protein [Methylobacterium platani]|uniref:DUF2946 domain-containing protein n=2 Tax=Methylobacterium platani TaxID=427683 RepID=A0A179RWT6_9HYPH|nr:hypothetical protein [Methylobacterium platani]OAS13853.1 hypothetical protein A5481_30775 [Methylobacterium platani]
MARWRALAAVLSLYGLLLQVFLVGLSPAPVAAASGFLCQGHHEGRREPAGRDGPAQAHACCPMACADPFAPPVPAAGPAFPPRAATGLTWRGAAITASRGPAAGSASARGPPAA